MDPRLGGGLAGCGCGAITALVAFVLTGTGITFAAYLAYEADLTHMQADTAVPLAAIASTLTSPCCGLAAAVVAAVLVYRLLSRGGD